MSHLTLQNCVYCGEEISWDEEPNPHCLPGCASASDRPINELARLAAENAKLRAALTDIKRHYELIAGTATPVSTVYSIATNALKALEEK